MIPNDLPTMKSLWRYGRYGLLFFISLFLLGRILLWLSHLSWNGWYLVPGWYSVPWTYPISIADPHIPDISGLLIVICWVVSAFWLWVNHIRWSYTRIIIFGIWMVILGTSILGWQYGWVHPMSGGGKEGIQLYHDTFTIESVSDFFLHYHQYQPTLLIHGQTRPPTMIALLYILRQSIPNPGIIAFILTMVSIAGTLWLLSILLKQLRFTDLWCRYGMILFSIIPGIQIYYGYSSNALTATFMLAALTSFFCHKRWLRIAGMTISLIVALSFTFLSFYIWGLICLLALLTWKANLKRFGDTFFSSIMVIIFFVAIWIITELNYLEMLKVASITENPYGFWGLAYPKFYLVTRLEWLVRVVAFYFSMDRMAFVEGILPF